MLWLLWKVGSNVVIQKELTAIIYFLLSGAVTESVWTPLVLCGEVGGQIPTIFANTSPRSDTKSLSYPGGIRLFGAYGDYPL